MTDPRLRNPAPVLPDATLRRVRAALAQRDLPLPQQQTIGPRSRNAGVKFPGLLSAADERLHDLVHGEGIRSQNSEPLADVQEAVLGSVLPMARIERLSADELGQLLPKLRQWVVTSAENPRGMTAHPKFNAKMDEQLASILRRAKIMNQPTSGKYKDPHSGQMLNGEGSRVLPGISPLTGRALGERFGQSGTLNKLGWMNPEGSYHPSSGLRPFQEGDPAYFELPSGQRFFSPIDWETTVPAKPMQLKHYSREMDLVETDPAMQGTGLAGTERRRTDKLPATYFYKQSATPERLFQGPEFAKYAAETTKPVYPLDKDPDQIIERMTSGGTRGYDYSAIERLLRELGFSGASAGRAVTMWDKVPIKRVRAVLAGAGLGAGATAGQQKD